jgi:transposase InsO family protein
LEQRAQFVLEWKKRHHSVAALCAVFGISRQTGYKYIERYRESGNDLLALQDHSRRPLSSPNATDAATIALLIRTRKRWPHWGPRKLRTWLAQRRPEAALPSASTIGDILKRNGLVRQRRVRRRTPPYTQPFATCAAPNQVWCVDFKGQFWTGNVLCYPLTITDAFSRFLIRCEALDETTTDAALEVFESAFREFGLPEVIRSDNGPPFASPAAGGLSELSVWWVRLGIRPERIEPGKPHQNGRHERMHLTLKRETASPPEKSLFMQQRRFDRFRREYNEQRPHEALQYATPSILYVRSKRLFRGDPGPLKATPSVAQARLDRNGVAEFGEYRIPISRVLACQYVEFHPVADRIWMVKFGPVELGLFDEARKVRSLIRPRTPYRPGKRVIKVSGMSPV